MCDIGKMFGTFSGIIKWLSCGVEVPIEVSTKIDEYQGDTVDSVVRTEHDA